MLNDEVTGTKQMLNGQRSRVGGQFLLLFLVLGGRWSMRERAGFPTVQEQQGPGLRHEEEATPCLESSRKWLLGDASASWLRVRGTSREVGTPTPHQQVPLGWGWRRHLPALSSDLRGRKQHFACWQVSWSHQHFESLHPHTASHLFTEPLSCFRKR